MAGEGGALARVIRNVVKEKNWTQRRAADVLGIAPPDVSDLMRGKVARFSQERLERFLNSLDMDVHIRVGLRAAGKKQASVTVELVAALYIRRRSIVDSLESSMAERRIGISELKSKLSECIREVRRGGTIVLTEDGSPGGVDDRRRRLRWVKRLEVQRNAGASYRVVGAWSPPKPAPRARGGRRRTVADLISENGE